MPAGDGVWRVWRVLEGLERLGRLERLESFGGFAGWQTAALKAHRKPLLWPGPGVPVGEVALALAVGCLLGKWPWPWGACWGRCLEFCFGKFGAFAG